MTSRLLGFRTPLALLLVLLTMYAATVSSNPSNDVMTADLAAWTIAQTGSPVPDITAYPGLDNNELRDVWIVKSARGEEVIGRAPGVIAASVPAYLFGPNKLSAIPAGLMAALLTAAGVVMFQRSIRQRLGDRSAVLAALLLGLTTPLWSVAADGMWPHTLTIFGILGMGWAAHRESWWLVGTFGSVAMWGRLHAALICAVLAITLAVMRRHPGIAIRPATVGTGMLALLCTWNHWMYGHWSPTSAYTVTDFTDDAGSRVFDMSNHVGLWISPGTGILIWTPLILVLIPALARSWTSLPDWSRALLIAGVVYSVLQTSLNRFSGGDSFYGYRIGLEMLACAAPALAMSTPQLGDFARRLLPPVAILQWVLMAVGGRADVSASVDPDRVWRENAFVNGWVEQPQSMLLITVPALLAGLLFIRVWADFKFDKAHHCQPSDPSDVRA